MGSNVNPVGLKQHQLIAGRGKEKMHSAADAAERQANAQT